MSSSERFKNRRLSQKAPYRASVSDARTSLVGRTGADLTPNLRMDLAHAQERIIRLEEANRALKGKLDKLRKAQAPMTRLVKEPTRASIVQREATREKRRPSMPSDKFPRLESSAEEVDAIRKRMADLDEQHRLDMDALELELSRERLNFQELSREKDQDVARLRALVKELEAAKQRPAPAPSPPEFSKAQMQALEKSIEERMRNKFKQAQQVFLLDIKASMMQEIDRLREKAAAMGQKYADQAKMMSTRWQERESEFRGLWDNREKEFSELLEKIRKNSKVTISRKVTVVTDEMENQSASEIKKNLEKQISKLDEYPELMKELTSSLGDWKGTPSDKLQITRGPSTITRHRG